MTKEGRSADDIALAVQEIDGDDDSSPTVGSPTNPSAADPHIDVSRKRSNNLIYSDTDGEVTMYNFKAKGFPKGPSFSAGCEDFDRLRQSLITSFLWQYIRGNLKWPKRMQSLRSNNHSLLKFNF